ncbi:thiamine-phosphate kinase [Corynebacterium choanae]|uniref:Thiamine-monophosphate kinase n=1 Tax=Corynebacterium choanae TaxID=1862358 RepID=A0A3G6JAB7_9CORY|nr:thiamine-phosphate kinase [Corynebacterium choanae]AZA13410.1 Thiamine-monophosphate kinase [Corynebacterium choanae]
MNPATPHHAGIPPIPDYPATPTVGDFAEHELIATITDIAPSARNGDDAAVIDLPNPAARSVITTDTLVCGRHFRHDFSTAYEVGHKAVVQNVADIVAMGATPQALLLALALPRTLPIAWITDFASGIAAMLDHYAIELVGGDITISDTLVIGVTATGTITGPKPPLTVTGARAGQHLLASGAIGHSAAGLDLLSHFGRNHIPPALAPLVTHHCAPRPAPGRGAVARATGASAMTDNSDGLIRDLTVIATRSGITIELYPDALQPDPLLQHAATLLGKDPQTWTLHGGEDHTLLAVSPTEQTHGFRVIGKTLPKGQHPILLNGKPPASTGGWDSIRSTSHTQTPHR